MELTFFGTGSGMPTSERNVSGLGLSLGSEWFLFDCGEGTQHQVMRSSLAPGRMSRVFISHLHGDHVYGLFGLLASRSMLGLKSAIEVTGPAGLEAMVRNVFDASATYIPYPLTFREVPDAGGPVVETPKLTVEAVPVDHRVTCFAWWIRESEAPGALDMERVKALGVPVGPALGKLKAGQTVTLEDGTRVEPDQVLGPSQPGRTLILSGDNRDPMGLLDRTGPVDLLVHEATFTEAQLEKMPDDKGHSTADRVARAAGGRVKNLVLTHFSARYQRGDGSIEEIGDEARAHYSGSLTLADDLARYVLARDGALSEA